MTATGVNYDSGDFLKVWDYLIKTIDLKKFRGEQREAWPGRYIGVGFGVGAELSGVASSVLVPMENQPGYGAATVRLDPRGKVQVFEGDAPGGQGHETSMAQVVAQNLVFTRMTYRSRTEILAPRRLGPGQSALAQAPTR